MLADYVPFIEHEQLAHLLSVPEVRDSFFVRNDFN